MPDSRRVDRSHGVDQRAVASAIAGLCGMLLVAAAVAYLAWRSGSPAPRLLAPNAAPDVRVSGVPLESSPRSVRAGYAAEKNRLLHVCEWLDPDAGIARIPIEAAMRALAERDATRRGVPAARPPQ